MKPHRVQLKRTKGWRMPENTVKVDRTTCWGNPFVVGQEGIETASEAVAAFRDFAHVEGCGTVPYQTLARMAASDLRGKNLACWCRQGDPCHADVLLELANQ